MRKVNKESEIQTRKGSQTKQNLTFQALSNRRNFIRPVLTYFLDRSIILHVCNCCATFTFPDFFSQWIFFSIIGNKVLSILRFFLQNLTWRFPTGRFLSSWWTIVYICWNLLEMNALYIPVRFASRACCQHLSSAPLTLNIRPVIGKLRDTIRNCKMKQWLQKSIAIVKNPTSFLGSPVLFKTKAIEEPGKKQVTCLQIFWRFSD